MAIGLAQSATYHLNIRRDQRHKRAVQEIGLVDLLEWTYRKQRAYDALMDEHRPDHRALRWLTGNASTLACMEKVAELGTQVDGGGRSEHAAHIDAQRVHDLVCQLARLCHEGQVAAGLIVEHARKGLQPERPEIRERSIRPTRGSRGAIRMSYWQDGRRLPTRPGRTMRHADGSRCRVGQACDITFVEASDLDLFMLEHHDLWAVGLSFVSRHLPTLQSWIVQDYLCPVQARCTRPAERLRSICDLLENG